MRTSTPASRAVTFAAACQQHGAETTWEKNLATTLDAIREAGRAGVDLLCLSELFLEGGVAGCPHDFVCELDSPRLDPIYEAIRSAGLHAVFSVREKAGGRFYNTVILVGPDGAVIGSYRKTHLTFFERRAGVSPGAAYPVFETALGKIGLLICWDGWFPESAGALARQGAEVICFPVAGDGSPNHWEHVWRARAMDNQVVWLASITGNCGGIAPSQVVAPDGEVLAQTREPNGLAIASVPSPWRREVFWLSVGPSHAEWRNVIDHSRRPPGWFGVIGKGGKASGALEGTK